MRRFWKIVFSILILIALLLIYAAWPGRSTFTVSAETTYVTEPLDENGNVDFSTALNTRLRGNITPEQNSNVLLWKALGPHPEGGTMVPEYFQWLGIESPPEEGDYMIPYTNYLKEHAKPGANEEFPGTVIQFQDYYDRQTRASKWPWTAKEDPELADWLKQNEKPLAVVLEAVQRPEYFNPLAPKKTADHYAGLIGALLPNVQKCREIAAALTCRAMLNLNRGKYEESWRDLYACHRLGRLMGRGGTLIEFLVGVAIETIASKAEVVFLERAKLPATQVVAKLETLRQLPPVSPLADKINQGERFMMLDSMKMVADRGPSVLGGESTEQLGIPNGKRFKDRLFTNSINWDPALRNGNRWYDRIEKTLRIADRTARNRELTAMTQEFMAAKPEMTVMRIIEAKTIMGPTQRGEMIGSVVIALFFPAIDKVQAASDRLEQGQRNLHLAFALAAYQADHGHYPAALAKLAPKYLESIPDDLFSGKPLTYRPVDKSYLLYSVGPNGIDDDGRGFDDEPKGDDLNVRIPVPEPQARN